MNSHPSSSLSLASPHADLSLDVQLDNMLDPDEFIARLKAIIPSQTQTFLWQMEVLFSLALVPLFINYARLYPEKKQEYLTALLNSIEIACSSPLVAIEAYAVNGAVVSTQPGAVTTPLFFILFPAGLAFILYQQIYSALNRKKIKNIIAESTLKHAKNANDIYLLEMSREQLEEIIYVGITQDTIDIIRTYSSYWQKLSANILKANRETAKYAIFPAIFAASFGLYKMSTAAIVLEKDTTCSLWTLFFNSCDTHGQAYFSILQVYPWLYYTTARAALQVIGTTSQLTMNFIPPSRKLGKLFFDKIHHPYETFFNLRKEDESTWTYKTLFWNIFFYSPTTLATLTVLFVRALNSANQYAYEHDCPSFFETMQLLLNNSPPPNPACTREEMVNVLAWLIGNFECSNLYPVLITLWLSSYFTAAMAERFTHLTEKISEQRATDLNKRFKHIHRAGLKGGIVGALIGAGAFIYLIRAFSNDIVHIGLKTYYETNTLFPNRFNSTYTIENYLNEQSGVALDSVFQRVCPYADLAGYISNKLNSGTLDTIRYQMQNNGTAILADITAGYEDFNVENLIWLNFLGVNIPIDPLLVFRVMIVLFTLFYSNQFAFFSTPYLLITHILLLAWACEPCFNRVDPLFVELAADVVPEEKSAVVELTQVVNKVESINANQQEPISDDTNRASTGCLARLFNRVYSATPIANQSRVGYERARLG